jgi:prevent-host-death family protein
LYNEYITYKKQEYKMEGSMETISSKEIRKNLSDILNKIAFKGVKYTLTRSGKNMAVIVSMEEWDEIEKILRKLEDEEDIKDADDAHARYSKEGGISIKKMREDLGL